MAIVSGLSAAAIIAQLLLPSPPPAACAGTGSLVQTIASPSWDQDGDGVSDQADHCPGTTRDFAVDASGCELDQDVDGVADGADRCPDTRPGAPGVDEPVDPDGCSVRDGKKERTYAFATQVG